MQTWQEKEKDDLCREFLCKLDACTSERGRIDLVMELVFGVSRAATRLENERLQKEVR